MLISDSSGMETLRYNDDAFVAAAESELLVVVLVVGLVVVLPLGLVVLELASELTPDDVSKLCLHVGQVLFMRNQCAKLSALNMWPQCLMRATRCVGSNESWVIEHTLLIGLTMVSKTTSSTRSSNSAWVSLRSSEGYSIPSNAVTMLFSKLADVVVLSGVVLKRFE